MSEEASVSRRHFLTVATSVTGVVGLALTAAPFIASFRPSTRAQALGAPVTVDISKLDEGAMVRVVWRGQPVWVLRRSKDMLKRLADGKVALKDPQSNESIQPVYARNDARALRPEYLVVIGNCTHLGCAPLERFEVAPADLGPTWVGGFFCPCHGSKFDLAARVMDDGSPAPTNLTIPPYRFVGDELVIVGEDTGAKA
jgi:ubiquinol-cytochrome c reductase iron-sulfur subunit